MIPCNQPRTLHTDGFVATVGENSELLIQAGTGKFLERKDINSYLDGGSIELVNESLKTQRICNSETSNVIPLIVGEYKIGVIYIDQAVQNSANMELLNIFANQAAVAIHNTQLYNMATFDNLTKVLMRGVFLNAVIRELRVNYRSDDPLCLMMIDVDEMKNINDTLGHLAGDEALKHLGDSLIYATRQSDIRGRMGGDEFAVLLINSDRKCVENVAKRIFDYLADKRAAHKDQSLPIRCSIGVCEFENTEPHVIDPHDPLRNIYFQYMCRKMISVADVSLYDAKHSGGNRMDPLPRKLTWQRFDNLKNEFEGQEFEIA